MSNFSSILGHIQTRPGNIILGSFPSGAAGEVEVESIVGVGQTIVKASDIYKSVVSNILVNQTILRANSIEGNGLTSILGRSDALLGRIWLGSTISGDTEQTFLDHIVGVSHQIEARNTNVRVSVTSNIAVTPEIRRNGDIGQIVQSNISVAQIVFARNTNVRISVTSAITASTPTDEHNTGVPESIESTSVVTTDVDFTIPRQAVIHTILVTSSFVSRNTVARRSVQSDISVGQAASFFQPNILVEQSGTVNQIIGFRNTNVRLSVQSNIAVAQLIASRNTNVRIGIVSSITIPIYNPYSTAVGRNSNNRKKVFTTATVTSTISGGNSNRRVSVADTVFVTQNIRHNRFEYSLSDHVFVNTAIGGGNSNREISVTTPVTVAQTVFPYSTGRRLSVSHSIFVDYEIVDKGPIVEIALTSKVKVTQNITFKKLQVQHVQSQIIVTQAILDRGDPNRQTVIHGINVNQFINARNTNVRLTVNSVGTVTQRVRIDELIVRHFVSVSQKINRLTHKHIIQIVGIGDEIVDGQGFNVAINQHLNLTQTVDRQMFYNRTIAHQLLIPESFYSRSTGFGDEQTEVPVAIGVILQKYITIVTETSTILLPPAEFDDAENYVGSIDIKKSMNGVSYVHKKSTDRRRLQWNFKLSLDKAIELRQFLLSNISKPMRITDWKAQQWRGYCMTSPFELVAETRYAKKREKVDISLEFEGIKLT